MKKYAVMTIAIFAMMALTTPLFATGDMNKSSKNQHEQGAAMDNQSQDMEKVGTIPTADELRGMEVYSQQGEELGEIEEVAVNDQTGEIRFVTISRGGILGIGEEDIPLSLEALTFQDDRATLTVDRSKLETVPQQANASDEQFQRDLQSHYGIAPVWKEDSTSMDKEKTSMQDNMKDDTTKPDLKSDSVFDDSDKKKSE